MCSEKCAKSAEKEVEESLDRYASEDERDLRRPDDDEDTSLSGFIVPDDEVEEDGCGADGMPDIDADGPVHRPAAAPSTKPPPPPPLVRLRKVTSDATHRDAHIASAKKKKTTAVHSAKTNAAGAKSPKKLARSSSHCHPDSDAGRAAKPKKSEGVAKSHAKPVKRKTTTC